MWIKFIALVSFVSLLISYFSILFVGWSWAEFVPWIGASGQRDVLIVSASLAIIFFPLWLLHWRVARRHWTWESKVAQNYLLFFTAMGLGASVVVGVQLLVRLMRLGAGTGGSFAENQDFLFGAAWSVIWSLWIWMHHGWVWLDSRRQTAATDGQPVELPVK